MATVLFETMFKPDTRIRSGISYGEIFIDSKNHLFIGLPLIEAYELEIAQDWSGEALTKDAEKRIPAWARKGRPIDWPVVPYSIPLKENHCQSTLAVNWTMYGHLKPFPVWSNISEVPTEIERSSKSDIWEKMQNTVAFHDSVCRSCSKKP